MFDAHPCRYGLIYILSITHIITKQEVDRKEEENPSASLPSLLMLPPDPGEPLGIARRMSSSPLSINCNITNEQLSAL